MIEDQLSKLKIAGLTSDQINLAIDPLRSFTLKLKLEIQEFEKSKDIF